MKRISVVTSLGLLLLYPSFAAMAGERRVTQSNINQAGEFCNGVVRMFAIDFLNDNLSQVRNDCKKYTSIFKKIADKHPDQLDLYLNKVCVCKSLMSQLNE